MSQGAQKTQYTVTSTAGIGGAGVFWTSVKIPTTYNNLPITEYGGVGIKLQYSACSGSDFRAYLFTSAPSSWRDAIDKNSNIISISGAPEAQNGAGSQCYFFTFADVRVEANKIYYICVATPDVNSASRLQLTSSSWFPELWVQISTTPLKLTYHQFGGAEIVSYEQVAGSYTALNPAKYTWNEQLLKDVWRNNNAYFAEWSTKASNGKKRSSGERIAAGATFNFTSDMDLYPMGALIENFDTTTPGAGAVEKKILLAPYYMGHDYALESNVSSNYNNVGVAFDVPKSLVANGELRERLLYVHQSTSWHLLNGPYQSQRGEDYFTYHLSGRGINQKKLYNSSLNNYDLRLIMLSNRSIDLGNLTSWPTGSWRPNYRTEFPNYVVIADSEIKGTNSLTAEQYQSISLPVYKIKLISFAEGVTDVARAGCSNAGSYWITSVDTNTCNEYFTYWDNLLGLKASSLRPSGSNLVSTASMINWVENNDGAIVVDEGVKPSSIKVSLWQKYNQGNYSNGKVASNQYNIVYQKENITIQTQDSGYVSTFIWNGVTPYLFACRNDVGTNLSEQTQISETKIRPQGFLYWRYNNKSYATLDSVAKNAFADLMLDEAPVIEAIVGDGYGFAYVKSSDTSAELQQGYIYVKQEDGTLVRCTPYQKERIQSSQLTPLILNANGVELT